MKESKGKLVTSREASKQSAALSDGHRRWPTDMKLLWSLSLPTELNATDIKLLRSLSLPTGLNATDIKLLRSFSFTDQTHSYRHKTHLEFVLLTI